jgi:hypothetical protein
MTKRRWIVLASLFAGAVCLTLAVLALLPPRVSVTKANYDRIEEGMTLKEVVGIFGGGPHWTEEDDEETYHCWIDEDGIAYVVCSGNQQFVRKEWRAAPRVSLLDRIRIWWSCWREPPA